MSKRWFIRLRRRYRFSWTKGALFLSLMGGGAGLWAAAKAMPRGHEAIEPSRSVAMKMAERLEKCPPIQLDSSIERIPERGWPSELWALATRSQKFREEAVDELLNAAGLKKAQTMRSSVGGVFQNPGARFWGSQNEIRLFLIPDHGWLRFTNSSEEGSGSRKTGEAPSEAATTETAVQWWKKLVPQGTEILLDPKTGKPKLTYAKVTQTRFSKSGETRQRRVAQKVLLHRSIRGIPVVTVGTYGGLWLSLGPGERLLELEWIGRDAEPLESLPLASFEDHLGALQECRNVAGRIGMADPSHPSRNEPVEALRVLGAVIVYFEEEPQADQKEMWPVVQWDVETIYQDKKIPGTLFTPVLRKK